MRNVINKSHRSALATIRSGTAPIRLETGRFENLPVNQRVCAFCPNLVEVEDVILKCPVYIDLRENLLLQAIVADLNSNLKIIVTVSC